ncbi:hypothetical protein [Streptomyces sp. NPDC088725]|uniref:hypothetical protein n=1 Tax=Streptomyces sp. NPDC088725 TaxID=3365873 RepID=UPI00380F492B
MKSIGHAGCGEPVSNSFDQVVSLLRGIAGRMVALRMRVPEEGVGRLFFSFLGRLRTASHGALTAPRAMNASVLVGGAARALQALKDDGTRSGCSAERSKGAAFVTAEPPPATCRSVGLDPPAEVEAIAAWPLSSVAGKPGA